MRWKSQKIIDTREQGAYGRFLEKIQLPGHKKIKDYSKGMKVKLAFAAALSHDLELLILDEATSGLDPIVRDGNKKFTNKGMN